MRMDIPLFILVILNKAFAANDDVSLPSNQTRGPRSGDVPELKIVTTLKQTDSDDVTVNITRKEFRNESSTVSSASGYINNVTLKDSTLNANKTLVINSNTTDVITLNVSTRRPSFLWAYCDRPGYTPYQYDPYWVWEFTMITRLYIKLPLAIIGIIGNSLSFLVLRKENRNTSTFLLQALAIVDLILCINYIVHEMVMVLYANSFALLPSRSHPVYQNWRKIQNVLQMYLLRFFEILSAWVITLISIDRYIAVCKPLSASTLSTIKRVGLALGIIVIAVAGLCLPRVFSLKPRTLWFPCKDEIFVYLVGADLWYNFWYNLWYVAVVYGGLTLVLPLVIVMVVQILLIRHLREASKNRASLTGDSKAAEKATLNLTLTLVVIAIVFFLCVTPELIVFVLKCITLAKITIPTYGPYGNLFWAYVANLFRFFNSVINFFIYCLVRQGFRKTLLDMFCKKWGTKQKLALGQSSKETKSTDVKSTDENP